MERIKKMTKKQKTIAAVTVAGIVLTGGVIGGVSSMNSDLDNELATAQETPEKRALELTLDYKENLKEEYEVNSGGEELSIKMADVTPEIDTSEMGTSNHEVEIDEIIFDLTVVVEDNRELKLNDFSELTLETEISKEDLETQMTEGLTPELEEGDELDFLFSYPEEFNLKNEGEYEVEVTARFANNHRNSVKQTVMINVEKPEEEVEEETEVDEVATETESTSSSASSNNSGSTGSTHTASTGGSDNSGSTGSSSGSAGTTGGSSNSGSTGSSSETVGSSNSGSSGSSSASTESSNSTGGESVSSSDPQDKDSESSSESTPSNEESESERSFGPSPTTGPLTPAPSGVPSGATKTGEDGRGGHEYSLYRSLPDGGNVTAAVVDTGVKDVLLVGVDNAGNHFIATVSRDSYGYMGDYPTISDEAANMLRELGSQFLSAHGM